MGFRALVIEDSIVFQQVMGEVLAGIDGIDHVDVVGRGREGLEAIDRGTFDVVFLDMNLPDMNGLEILESLKGRPRTPQVIVVSSAGGAGTDMTVKALQLGALEVVCKPAGAGFAASVTILSEDLGKAVKALAARRMTPLSPAAAPARPAAPPAKANTVLTPPGGFWITALAVSTGGPESLARVIPNLPGDYPTPIVMVQHMPPLFTASLAKSLDSKSALTVVEAEEGMEILPRHVYIAPGGKHMFVRRESGRSIARLNEDPPECNVRPAADVLFRSLSIIPEKGNVLAVVMTGMGCDGLDGVRTLKTGRCHCLSQTEDTCVVYGMPRAVDEAGLSDEQVALDDIAGRMAELNAFSMARMR